MESKIFDLILENDVTMSLFPFKLLNDLKSLIMLVIEVIPESAICFIVSKQQIKWSKYATSIDFYWKYVKIYQGEALIVEAMPQLHWIPHEIEELEEQNNATRMKLVQSFCLKNSCKKLPCRIVSEILKFY